MLWSRKLQTEVVLTPSTWRTSKLIIKTTLTHSKTAFVANWLPPSGRTWSAWPSLRFSRFQTSRLRYQIRSHTVQHNSWYEGNYIQHVTVHDIALLCTARPWARSISSCALQHSSMDKSGGGKVCNRPTAAWQGATIAGGFHLTSMVWEDWCKSYHLPSLSTSVAQPKWWHLYSTTGHQAQYGCCIGFDHLIEAFRQSEIGCWWIFATNEYWCDQQSVFWFEANPMMKGQIKDKPYKNLRRRPCKAALWNTSVWTSYFIFLVPTSLFPNWGRFFFCFGSQISFSQTSKAKISGSSQGLRDRSIAQVSDPIHAIGLRLSKAAIVRRWLFSHFEAITVKCIFQKCAVIVIMAVWCCMYSLSQELSQKMQEKAVPNDFGSSYSSLLSGPGCIG